MNICKLIIEIDTKAMVDLIYFVDIASLNSHSYSALISDFRYLILPFEEAYNVILGWIFCLRRGTILWMYFWNPLLL
jgi:hypothetical protein